MILHKLLMQLWMGNLKLQMALGLVFASMTFLHNIMPKFLMMEKRSFHCSYNYGANRSFLKYLLFSFTDGYFLKFTLSLFSVSLQSLYSSHVSRCLDYYKGFDWICEVSHWNQSISLFFSAGFVKWSHKVQLVHPKIGEAVYLSKSSGSFQNHVWSSSSLHFYSCKQTYVHLLRRIFMKET